MQTDALVNAKIMRLGRCESLRPLFGQRRRLIIAMTDGRASLALPLEWLLRCDMLAF